MHRSLPARAARLRKDLAGLGWQSAPPVFGNFTDPLNTWADMSHLLPREELDPALGVQNVAYFCGAMPDTIPATDPAGQAHVQESTTAVLNGLASTFWPGTAAADGTFDPAHAAMTYFRWNTTPSERYVLTVAGSTRHRLAPDESGFVNVTLAGDYTRNGWNIGCVEATVMSGRLASRAISGYPRRKDIAYVDGP